MAYTAEQVRLCKGVIKLHARFDRDVTWDEAAEEVGLGADTLATMKADRRWTSWCRDAARELLAAATTGGA